MISKTTAFIANISRTERKGNSLVNTIPANISQILKLTKIGTENSQAQNKNARKQIPLPSPKVFAKKRMKYAHIFSSLIQTFPKQFLAMNVHTAYSGIPKHKNVPDQR